MDSPSLSISHVLTLTKEEPLLESWFTTTGVERTNMPVESGRSPSMQQIEIFMLLATRHASGGRSLLIHCGGGKRSSGDTFSMLARLLGFHLSHTRSRMALPSHVRKASYRDRPTSTTRFDRDGHARRLDPRMEQVPPNAVRHYPPACRNRLQASRRLKVNSKAQICSSLSVYPPRASRGSEICSLRATRLGHTSRATKMAAAEPSRYPSVVDLRTARNLS